MFLSIILFNTILLYVIFSIKNKELTIINNNLVFEFRTFFEVIIIIIFLLKILLLLPKHNLCFTIIFYVIFFNFFILKIRLELLKLYFFFFSTKNVAQKFFYKTFLAKFFGYNYFAQLIFFENFLRKAFVVLVPFFIYIFCSSILNLFIIVILTNFKFTDFDIICNKAIFQIFDEKSIILTNKGKIVVSKYKKFLIQNTMKFSLKKRISHKFIWGEDFYFSENIHNEIMLKELNLQ